MANIGSLFKKSKTDPEFLATQGRVRVSLLKALSRAIKEVQLLFTEQGEGGRVGDCRATQRLCSTFENVLRHGQKVKWFSQHSSFWGLVLEISRKQAIEYINGLQYAQSDSAKCRAWIRMAVNECSLESYIAVICQDSSLLSQHYESYAFLRDEDAVGPLQQLLTGLSQITFNITVDTASLEFEAVPEALQPPLKLRAPLSIQEKKERRPKKRRTSHSHPRDHRHITPIEDSSDSSDEWSGEEAEEGRNGRGRDGGKGEGLEGEKDLVASSEVSQQGNHSKGSHQRSQVAEDATNEEAVPVSNSSSQLSSFAGSNSLLCSEVYGSLEGGGEGGAGVGEGDGDGGYGEGGDRGGGVEEEGEGGGKEVRWERGGEREEGEGEKDGAEVVVDGGIPDGSPVEGGEEEENRRGEGEGRELTPSPSDTSRREEEVVERGGEEVEEGREEEMKNRREEEQEEREERGGRSRGGLTESGGRGYRTLDLILAMRGDTLTQAASEPSAVDHTHSPSPPTPFDVGHSEPQLDYTHKNRLNPFDQLEAELAPATTDRTTTSSPPLQSPQEKVSRTNPFESSDDDVRRSSPHDFKRPSPPTVISTLPAPKTGASDRDQPDAPSHSPLHYSTFPPHPSHPHNPQDYSSPTPPTSPTSSELLADIHLPHVRRNQQETERVSRADSLELSILMEQTLEEPDSFLSSLQIMEDYYSPEVGIPETQEAIRKLKAELSSSSNSPTRMNSLRKSIIQLQIRLQKMKEELENSDPCQEICGHKFVRQPRQTRVLTGFSCLACRKRVRGLIREWYQCRTCQSVCHKKCLPTVTHLCVIPGEDAEYTLEVCPEVGLTKQQFRCNKCNRAFSQPPPVEARLCDYEGRYYCTDCHSNDLAVIPARVMHNWDFTTRKVCCQCSSLLFHLSHRPLLRVDPVNPLLYTYVQDLVEIECLRSDILHMKKYFMECKAARDAQLLHQLDPFPHFKEGTSLLTLHDMVEIQNGSLLPVLKSICHSFSRHIKKECSVCSEKYYRCSMCSSEDALYPFDHDVSVCSNCQAVYHKSCFNEISSCLKCRAQKNTK